MLRGPGDPNRAPSRRALAHLHIISPELATAIEPAAGLRNPLVHRYGDIRLDLLASAIGEMLDLFAQWWAQVAASLLD